MKLKVQHVMDATMILASIITEKRPMPQRGKYLLARVHSKLYPDFLVINARRDEMIKAYDTLQTKIERTPEDPIGKEVPMEGKYRVPEDKNDEFIAAWKIIGNEEIDIDVSPIPLLAISLPDGSDGAIEAGELITLGELVCDTAS